MIGIYKFTNKINGHSYIGQSINIENRVNSHRQRAYCNSENNKEYEKTFYKAIRKYGWDNFDFEVLEICSKEELNEREIYYIDYYDTYHNGYNEEKGGGMFLREKDGEKHPNHKLSEADVYTIREAYKNHCIKEEVYKNYEDKIGSSGFNKIWNGNTWQKIHMDVYTKENRAFHTYIRNSHPGKGIGNRLSIDQIKEIKRRAKEGETFENVYEDFKDKFAKDVVKRVYEGITYKDII